MGGLPKGTRKNCLSPPEKRGKQGKTATKKKRKGKGRHGKISGGNKTDGVGRPAEWGGGTLNWFLGAHPQSPLKNHTGAIGTHCVKTQEEGTKAEIGMRARGPKPPVEVQGGQFKCWEK